jgi:hypothetical protein
MLVSELKAKLIGMNDNDTIAAFILTADDLKNTIDDRSDESGFKDSEFTTADINEVLTNIENDVEQYGVTESVDFQLDVFVEKFLDNGDEFPLSLEYDDE